MGNGSGNYGNIPSQPYAGGSVKGSGSDAGTALVSGGVDNDDVAPSYSDAHAAFNSNGGGSDFIDSPFGGAVGNGASRVLQQERGLSLLRAA